MVLSINNTFVDGTKALAAEVNDNFQQCEDAINQNAADIATNATSIATITNTTIPTLLKKDGSVALTALQSYSTDLTPSDNKNLVPKKYVDDLVPMGYISGLTLSNNATTPNTKIDISVGVCADSANSVKINNLATLTLDLAASGANGIDTGSKANSTWYHIYITAKADGTTASLASTSATSPTLPATYTVKRRIGSIKTDSSGNIIGFIQNGDKFSYKIPINDASAVAFNTTAALVTLSVPTGIKVQADLFTWADASGAQTYGLFTDPATTDTSPAPGATNLIALQSTGIDINGGSRQQIYTNTSGQIRVRFSSTTGVYYITNYGYIDSRGL